MSGPSLSRPREIPETSPHCSRTWLANNAGLTGALVVGGPGRIEHDLLVLPTAAPRSSCGNPHAAIRLGGRRWPSAADLSRGRS